MKNVLLVAPANDARSRLTARLEQDGYLVVAADDAGQAADVIEVLTPGVIVIDVPVSSPAARKLLRRLEGERHLRALPRMLVTSSFGRPSRVNASAVFLKPLDQEHFARALRSLYPVLAQVAASVVANAPAHAARASKPALKSPASAAAPLTPDPAITPSSPRPPEEPLDTLSGLHELPPPLPLDALTAPPTPSSAGPAAPAVAA